MAEDRKAFVAPAGGNGQIERAKQQLERMIDLTPQTMLLMNGDGTVVRTNRSLLNLLGLQGFGEVLGRHLYELFDCGQPQFFAEFLAAEGGYVIRETRVRMHDGKIRTLEFSLVGKDRPEGACVVIVRDTTEEKEQSARVEQSFKHEAVQALMGALMHHLNQPLTVISVRAKLMQLELEKGHVEPAELKKTLQDIMDLTVRMADILKKVADSPVFATEDYIEGLEIMDIDR